MHKVIDTPWNTGAHATALKQNGVETIIRYFNHTNSSKLPEKRIAKTEAETLAAAGLSLAVVFQQRGGAGGQIGDLDKESGERDASRALDLAKSIGQPKDSAIYFAVDHDYWKPSDLQKIAPYFAAVAKKLKGKHRVGVYGSGTVGKTMRDLGDVDLIWLAAAKGWSGTKDMLETEEWALYQQWPPINDPLPHDGNTVSAAWHDYGQFTPGGTAAANLAPEKVVRAPRTVLLEVTARSGLKVRRGPSQDFAVETALPSGSIVHGLAERGGWIQVDIQGDGHADGFMHADYLRPVSGGFPVSVPSTAMTPPPQASAGSPYATALSELALDVKEVAGGGNNPRIVMYHNSTTAGAGTNDSVPWCSSFVNYCVEQADLEGTNSQWALSWENWGQDVSNDPKEGDVVVFERVGQGGHVGFYRADLGSHLSVLGGNQSNRVKVSNYPKNGQLGQFTYKLRGIRRG